MFNNYSNYLQYLKQNANIKLKDFASKLINTKYEILGIKLPFLRKLAKGIIKNNQQNLILSKINFIYYEEILVYAFVLANLNIIENERIYLIKNFLSFIDNWSVCDSFCATLKSVKKNKELYLKFIKEILNSNKTYFQRVGIVLLMNYYLNEKALNKYFNLVLNVDNDDYYIQMAKAWFFATSLAKNYNQTLEFLKLNKEKLSKDIRKKIISKCNDSFRVKEENKIEIKSILG